MWVSATCRAEWAFSLSTSPTWLPTATRKLHPGSLDSGRPTSDSHRVLNELNLHVYSIKYIYIHYIPYIHYIHYIHYITLHCIALHCITLHYIALHYIHTYTHTHIHTYTHTICITIFILIYLYLYHSIPIFIGF